MVDNRTSPADSSDMDSLANTNRLDPKQTQQTPNNGPFHSTAQKLVPKQSPAERLRTTPSRASKTVQNGDSFRRAFRRFVYRKGMVDCCCKPFDRSYANARQRAIYSCNR